MREDRARHQDERLARNERDALPCNAADGGACKPPTPEGGGRLIGRRGAAHSPMDQAFPEAETPADVHGHEGGRQVRPRAQVETAGGLHGGKGEAQKVDREGNGGEERNEGGQHERSQPDRQQPRRHEMAGLERGGMQSRDVGLAATVAAVLREKVANRLAALPADLQLGIEEELASVPPDAIVELEVLVREQPFVPTAELAYQRGGIGAEWNVIDRPDAAAVVIGGVADAEGGGHRGRDRAAGGRDTMPVFPATDPAPIAGLEVVDEATDVVVRHLRMGIDADEPGAARRTKREVERGGDGPRVVDQWLDPAVATRKRPNDGARAIRRRAIDDQHLEIGPVLVEDRGQAGPEV